MQALSDLGRIFGQQVMAVLSCIQADPCLKEMRLYTENEGVRIFSIMWQLRHGDKLVRSGKQ